MKRSLEPVSFQLMEKRTMPSEQDVKANIGESVEHEWRAARVIDERTKGMVLGVFFVDCQHTLRFETFDITLVDSAARLRSALQRRGAELPGSSAEDQIEFVATMISSLPSEPMIQTSKP